MDGASRLLERFGVHVGAATDPAIERDVLRFTINPSDDIQYDQVVNDSLGIFNCWVTSSFQDAVRFTNFDMSTGAPNLELSSANGQSVLAILDRTANLQVRISSGPTYELRDGELVSIG